MRNFIYDPRYVAMPWYGKVYVHLLSYWGTVSWRSKRWLMKHGVIEDKYAHLTLDTEGNLVTKEPTAKHRWETIPAEGTPVQPKGDSE